MTTLNELFIKYNYKLVCCNSATGANAFFVKKDFENELFVKVRSTGKLLNAKIDIKDQNTAEVNLKNSEDGISPGQACVFYNKDKDGYKVLGGGWIKG